MDTELLQRQLPKWPQCLITGKSVTEAQAKEIIRRTDTFFDGYGGNARSWNRWVWEQFGLPVDGRWGDLSFETLVDFRKKYQPISSNYIHNSWISCSFIGGPHGWCHPNGRISYSDNIGKYPSAEEVLRDWQRLAEAFPFVDLGCVLMNNEGSSDDIEPVVGFRVKDGLVSVVDPLIEDPLAGFDPPSVRGDSFIASSVAALSLTPEMREVGIPRYWIVEWAEDYKRNNS